MPPINIQLDALKTILDNIFQPQRLDSHPWADSLIAHEGEREPANGQDKSPGHRLVIAIGKIFPHMMPSTPPLSRETP